MAVKSLRPSFIGDETTSGMDHKFNGVPVASMNAEQLAEARKNGLHESIIRLYHGEPADPFEAALKGISATSEKAIRAEYDTLDALRADVVSGTLVTLKGVSQKAADQVAKNFEKE